jgi:hypothetical protein
MPPVPPELLEEALVEDEVDDELLDDPQLDGSGAAWHLQVSTLHHQPP